MLKSVGTKTDFCGRPLLSMRYLLTLSPISTLKFLLTRLFSMNLSKSCPYIILASLNNRPCFQKMSQVFFSRTKVSMLYSEWMLSLPGGGGGFSYFNITNSNNNLLGTEAFFNRVMNHGPQALFNYRWAVLYFNQCISKSNT